MTEMRLFHWNFHHGESSQNPSQSNSQKVTEEKSRQIRKVRKMDIVAKNCRRKFCSFCAKMQLVFYALDVVCSMCCVHRLHYLQGWFWTTRCNKSAPYLWSSQRTTCQKCNYIGQQRKESPLKRDFRKVHFCARKFTFISEFRSKTASAFLVKSS